MTTKTKLGFTIGLLATALLAACGGGGGGTSTTLPAKSAGNSGGGTGAQATTTGPHLTLTINRKKPAKSASASKRNGFATGSKRSPQYVSSSAYGLQVTVTSGSTTQTIYADLNNFVTLCSENQTTDIETCSIPLPSLGTMETIAAIEVDQYPSNENTSTGLGTAFPSNSHILALGNTTATLAAGQNTAIPLSLNPIIGQLADDCGYGAETVTYDNNMNFDTTDGRIVVTANVPSSVVAATDVADADYDFIFPNIDSSGPAPALQGQPFVDVNGSPEPLTLTSNASNVSVAMGPGGYGFPSPVPSPMLAQSASVADTSSLYTGYDDCGNLLMTVAYVPGPSPSPNAAPPVSTLVLSANLSATPPSFTGIPVPQNNSALSTSFTFVVTPISASPASLALTFGGGGATVTGYDPGAQQPRECCQSSGMSASAPPPFVAGSTTVYQTTSGPTFTTSCEDSQGNTIAQISSATYSGVSQIFTITPVATPPTGITGTDQCTIVLYDNRTGVITNPVTISIAQPA